MGTNWPIWVRGTHLKQQSRPVPNLARAGVRSDAGRPGKFFNYFCETPMQLHKACSTVEVTKRPQGSFTKMGNTMSNKATAAQAGFIASLANQKGMEAFEAAFNNAARLNQNRPYAVGETVTQAVRRLTKTAASRIIDELKNA